MRWHVAFAMRLWQRFAPHLIRLTVFGYTAITGATGAGGLGNIAFRFGYQRYQQSVMYASLALVILVVCLIQTVFGHLASKADKRNR